MKIKFMVSVQLIVGLCLLLTLSHSMTVVAEESGSIRIYKMSKKGQLKKKNWTKKVEAGVCFDFRKPQKAHRFAQTRYQYCSLFAKQGCGGKDFIEAMWGGSKYRAGGLNLDVNQPQTKFYRGTKWMLHPNKNVILKSMKCHS